MSLLTSRVTFKILDRAVFCQSSKDFGVTSMEGLGEAAFSRLIEESLEDGGGTTGYSRVYFSKLRLLKQLSSFRQDIS